MKYQFQNQCISKTATIIVFSLWMQVRMCWCSTMIKHLSTILLKWWDLKDTVWMRAVPWGL